MKDREQFVEQSYRQIITVFTDPRLGRGGRLRILWNLFDVWSRVRPDELHQRGAEEIAETLIDVAETPLASKPL